MLTLFSQSKIPNTNRKDKIMKKLKLAHKEERVVKSPMLYARLECMSCHETYYARTDDSGTIVIPNFVSEFEIFPADCPVCENGRYAMLITYL